MIKMNLLFDIYVIYVREVKTNTSQKLNANIRHSIVFN